MSLCRLLCVLVPRPLALFCLLACVYVCVCASQVLVPLQFDQFFHAERLHDLGLAPAPIKAELLVGTAATTTPPPQPPTSEAHARDQGVTVLSEALQWTLGPGVAGRCRDFAQVRFACRYHRHSDVY